MVWGVVFCLFVFFCIACQISVPWPGIEPGPQQWKCQVLTARPPGNSLSHGSSTNLCKALSKAVYSPIPLPKIKQTPKQQSLSCMTLQKILHLPFLGFLISRNEHKICNNLRDWFGDLCKSITVKWTGQVKRWVLNKCEKLLLLLLPAST